MALYVYDVFLHYKYLQWYINWHDPKCFAATKGGNSEKKFSLNPLKDLMYNFFSREIKL